MNKQAKRSWIFLDVGNSAFSTTILAAVFPIYFPHLLPSEGVLLSIGAYEWKTSAIALWGYAVSLSIFLTLIISPILGAWADESSKRKLCLAVFTSLGCLFTCGLGIFQDWRWVLSCFVFANIGYAASNIFYNALIESVAPEEEWDRLSLQAYAWGYIGGGLLLAINLLMIQKFEWFGLPSKAAGSRLSFMSVGVWWILFSLPAFITIKEKARAHAEFYRSLRHRLLQLGKTIQSLPHIPSLLIFIISFAFFNDGIQTVISMASIYGKEVLSLQEGTLIGTLLMIQFLGWPFTLIMIRLAKYFGAKKLLSTSIVIWVGIVAYAYFMKAAIDFWLLGLFVAIVLGVSQALARSIYARLIPVGKQAEYFSLYALSGKMSSMMGPLFFSVVQDITGNSRLAILSLGIFFVIGLVLLQWVSVDRRVATPLQ